MVGGEEAANSSLDPPPPILTKDLVQGGQMAQIFRFGSWGDENTLLTYN